MELFKIKIETTQSEERILKVINIDHNIPVWLYSPRRMLVFGSNKSTGLRLTNCAICNQPLSSITIPNGDMRPNWEQLDHCTVIQTEDGATYPMHKYCFDKSQNIG